MQPQLIAGRYQVLRAIGRGGMGTVWLCCDDVLGREVAAKQMGAVRRVGHRDQTRDARGPLGRRVQPPQRRRRV